MYYVKKKRKKNKRTKKKEIKQAEVRKDLYTDIYIGAQCVCLSFFSSKGWR